MDARSHIRPGHKLLFLPGEAGWGTAVHGGSYSIMKVEHGWRAEYVTDAGTCPAANTGMGSREEAEKWCQDHYDRHKCLLGR